MSKWAAIIGVLTVTVLTVPMPAAAQQSSDAAVTTPRANPPVRGAARAARSVPLVRGNGRANAPGAGATVAEVEQAFDRYFLNQARLTLQLSPTQMAAFRPRLEHLQRVRRQTQRQRQVLLNELQSLGRAGGAVDDEALAAKLKALDAHKAESEQLIRDAYEQLDATLSVQQRVRFRPFEQRMEQRKLELIAGARAQARRGGPAAAQGQ